MVSAFGTLGEALESIDVSSDCNACLGWVLCKVTRAARDRVRREIQVGVLISISSSLLVSLVSVGIDVIQDYSSSV